MDWKLDFDIVIPFLEDYLDSVTPGSLARTLTITNESNFANLLRMSFITQDAILGHLLAN